MNPLEQEKEKGELTHTHTHLDQVESQTNTIV